MHFVRHIYFSLIVFILLFHSSLIGEEPPIPVLFKGRIRPLQVYSQLWLNDFYGSKKIKKEHNEQLPSSPLSTDELIWKLHFFGSDSFQNVSLFKIDSLSLKTLLDLNPKNSHFSYNELAPLFRNRKISQGDEKLANDFSSIRDHLQQFQMLEGTNIKLETQYQESFHKLVEAKTNKKQISLRLEELYPLFERLKIAGNLLKILPSHYPSGEWFSPHAFKTKIYSMEHHSLIPVGNFTLFSDHEFEELRQLYLKWEQSVLTGDVDASFHQKAFFERLHRSYLTYIHQSEHSFSNNALSFPTSFKLKLETMYYAYPLIESVIFLYFLSIILLFLSIRQTNQFLKKICYLSVLMAFLFHLLILITRSIILGRPPVSNMFETVIYVPLVSMLFGLTFYLIKRQTFILIISCLSALLLLVMIKLTDLNSHLENVQPVLNSQFWLIVHVLMIVGSYGLFIIAGLTGHFYLINYLKERDENSSMKSMSEFILQSIYLGTGLLISGTILGGVWAAQSWGRFWDWDPKESWAFISSCIYLIWIHAHRFHKITNFGLAIGSVVGVLAISFTWYGVNYILGTGFHSYGFGQGGQIYYYIYVLSELLFLSFVIFRVSLFRDSFSK